MAKKKTAEFSLSDRSSRERGILNGLTTQLLQQQTLSLSQPTAAAETEMKKKRLHLKGLQREGRSSSELILQHLCNTCQTLTGISLACQRLRELQKRINTTEKGNEPVWQRRKQRRYSTVKGFFALLCEVKSKNTKKNTVK